MRFFAIRYFVIQDQLQLFPLDDSMHPRELFVLPLLDTKRKTTYYNTLYTTRLILDEAMSALSNKELVKQDYLLGFLMKSKDTHLIQLDETLFNEEDIVNWEKLLFFIDTKNQIIIFELNRAVAEPENIRNSLLEITKASIQGYGYAVTLEFISDTQAFWDLINSSNGLYRIKFQLSAPNLFGSSKQANEWLKQLKDVHNMETVTFDIRNENANLRYDEQELESYRDYADSGGGNWTLGVVKNGRKELHKSANFIRQKERDIPAENPNFVKRNRNLIVKELQEIVRFFSENETS